MRLCVLGVCALFVCGCGGAPRSAVRVDVTVSTSFPHERTAHYTLRCRPAGGSLPHAARVCADIARHPGAMLTPGRPRSVCAQPPGAPEVTVDSHWDGRAFSYADSPGCDWPRGAETGVYYAAATGDLVALGRYERILRCDDDPVLLYAKPTRHASIVACTRGRWTPRTERLIRIASRVVRPLGVAFPREIGARPCSIPAGGLTMRRLSGTCGVDVLHTWNHPQVTFVEDFPNGPREQRHRWRVRVDGDRARLVSQSGPEAPQNWR